MKKTYFLRHGRPDFGLDERYCLGVMDKPLGTLGKMQSCLAAREILRQSPDVTVFSSPIGRAVQTAEIIKEDYVVFPDLGEAAAGEWDGLSFEEIKERWPDVYEARGRDRSIPIPGSETPEHARERFGSAVEILSLMSPGDTVFVAHDTVFRLHLGMDEDHRIPYGAYVLDGEIHIPHEPMTRELALALRDSAGMLDHIKSHCDAVAQEALRLAEGYDLDTDLIECAALLHDIARLEKKHESVGGRYLDILGYPEIGDIIRQHGELDSVKVNEATVVFLADKLIRETEHVTIEQRYDISSHKNMTPEGMEIHNRRLAQALEAERLIKGN